MTTALDIITGALLNINSYSPGEAIQPADSQAALAVFNDLLDSLSNDEAFVYTQTEFLYPWIAGQFQYSVGNYIGGSFTGNLTGGNPTITGVTVPSNLVMGGTLTDPSPGYGVIPSGTTVTGIGSNTITMSQNATTTPAGTDTVSYTIPGNIAMPRPLRFRDGFTRANTSTQSNLDYAFQMVDFDRYKEELLKNVQGPWPYIATYQPTFPLGTLYVYPCPGSNYTAHIFTDILLSDLATVNAAFSLPQGYNRALKKLLALELAPRYGKTVSPELRLQAREAKELIMATNQTPVKTLRYDSAIVRSQGKDASWIMHGGFH